MSVVQGQLSIPSLHRQGTSSVVVLPVASTTAVPIIIPRVSEFGAK